LIIAYKNDETFKTDYNELKVWPMLFARKFQWDVDENIIKNLREKFCGK